jgi:hypothetical protein
LIVTSSEKYSNLSIEMSAASVNRIEFVCYQCDCVGILQVLNELYTDGKQPVDDDATRFDEMYLNDRLTEMF